MTIGGHYLDGANSVTFGSTPASSFSVDSTNTMPDGHFAIDISPSGEPQDEATSATPKPNRAKRRQHKKARRTRR